MAEPEPAAVTVQSPVAAPFRLSYARDYFRRFPAACVERTDAVSYVRALDAASAMRVEAAGSTTAPALRIRVWRVDGRAPTAAEVAVAVATARRAFAADDPLPPAPGDAVLAGLASRWPGLRPARFPDPFECLCWAILGQQITVAFAARLKRTLLERYGHRGPDGLPLFPAPADLAAADPEELRAAQFSRQKIRYLLAVAQDPPDWAAIARLPAEEAIAALTALPGIGRWTAEYVLMRSLGFREVIPAADAGLKRAVGIAYGLGRRATEAEVRERAAGWPGFAAYAAFHWWYALQQGVY
jgi:3-methyladenine DNA glycosylase/8-oxoguanine DNA glycosylase